MFAHHMAKHGPWYCPSCSAQLWDKEIPEPIREHYSPPYWYMRRIGIYDRGCDRTVEWRCPSCSHQWPRR
jgi:transposase-like protein